jgi:hypothetical protein
MEKAREEISAKKVSTPKKRSPLQVPSLQMQAQPKV